MADIPAPLRSGEYTLKGGTYTGDVGSLDPANPAVLNLKNGASATVSVAGSGDPIGPGGTGGLPHYAFIEAVNGKETLNLTTVGGGRSPFGPGFATVYIDPHVTLTGSATTTLTGHLTIQGGPGSKLQDFSGSAGGGSMVINTNIAGTGTITMPVDYPSFGGLLEINGRVGHGETINVNAGLLQLDQPLRFLGQINFNAGPDPLERVLLQNVTASSYSYDGHTLRLFLGSEDIEDVKIALGQDALPIHVSQAGSAVMVSASDPAVFHNGAVPLPVHDSAMAWSHQGEYAGYPRPPPGC